MTITLTDEQRAAIEATIADCEARAEAARLEWLAHKKTMQAMQQRAALLRSMLPVPKGAR